MIWVIVLSLNYQVQAQPLEPGPPDDIQDREAHELLQTLRVYKMIKDVGIDETLGMKIFPKLNQLDEFRRLNREERLLQFHRLRELLAATSPIDQEQVQAFIKTIRDLDTRLRNRELEVEDEILALLSPAQRAKFLMFQEDFPREIRKNLNEIRRRGPKNRQRHQNSGEQTE